MSDDHYDGALATVSGVEAPLMPDDSVTDTSPAGIAAGTRYVNGTDARGVRSDPPPAERAPTVALIIPAKNEAANISWVLEQVPSCVDEVVLVDGNSTDATLVTARCARPDIRVLVQEGTGKGDALRAGFLATEADIVVMIDADCSMTPQELPHFLHFLSNGYDFVKGSRFMAGGGSHDITRLRRWGNRALVSMVNVLFEVQMTDLCYGFCAFHRRYLPFLDLTSAGFEVETRLTLSALAAGLRVAEVPSLEMPRRYGRSNLRTFPDGTRVLLSILRSHRRGIRVAHNS
ncbi:MAG TPA: glycosyltransferase family 2 protein [Actinomycetospora sp.]|jgi:glycosyltransferase involved in cell wall biosynthesis|uniref:glycosyltransferase family 2 protein n=1 Tax=Actinomycetospora sp. TaxID=1872135 RepID=UPI002F3F4EAB